MTDNAADVMAQADADTPVERRSLWSRFSAQSPVVLAVLALILGFLIGALVIIFSTNTVLDAWRGLFSSWGAPGHAIKVTFDNVGAAYRAMFTGSVFDPAQIWHSITTGKQWDSSLTPISETLTYATPLVIASIAVGIAFQTGIFNIGANGQAIMGGIAGCAIGSMINMPAIIHIPLTLIAGLIGGMVAGAIPGFLKAFTGAHEVIVTLMLNYVVAFFLVFVLLSTALQLPGQSNDISRTMYSSAQLAPLFGVSSGLRVSYGIFIAAGVVWFAWWFLDRSSLGFDFRITGNNPNAARASGINARRIIVVVFLISGGLAGLAGVVQVASTTHYVDGNFLIGSAGIGFTAITVALLGRNRPMGIVWGSLLFAALGVGGRNMQAATGIPLDLATIIQSVVVLFVATPVLVKEIFRLRASSAQGIQLATKGWGIMSDLVDILPDQSPPPAARARPVGRVRVIGYITAGLGLFILLAFGLGSAGNAHSVLTFTPVNTSTNAPWSIGALTVLTRYWNMALGLIAVGIGVDMIVRRPPKGAMVRFGVGAVLFLFALLLWAGRSPGPSQVPYVNLTSILIGSSALAMVLIYGALSGVMCERAGVVNIAIEGQFIGGAFFGSVIASTTNNFLLATLAGAVAGALLGLILAFLSLRYLSDQIIVGVVLVTMMSSLSSYLNLQVLSPYPNLNTGNLASNIAIPLLDKIPIIGPVFFNESGFFYFMIVLVGVISFGLFKTRWGLRVRAVGEHPKAAESVGINVIRTRYINVVAGGAIAGIGGVAFMSSQGAFQVGYTSGLGYVALAALIFGRWRPSGAVSAAVLFGISAYLALNLQTYNIPISTEILGMFPYLITIAVVAGLVGRVRPPAADGQPYKRD